MCDGTAEEEIVLGEGSFGTVVKSSEHSATKHCKNNPDLLGIDYSTMRELAALKHLQPHPNIAHLKSFKISKDYCEFTMPLGVCTLCRWYEEKLPRTAVSGGPGTRLFRDVMRQLFEAVAWMHDRGVVHRDINSRNVVMLDDNLPMLIDFGLSKSTVGTPIVSEGTVFGTAQQQTLYWRAPEILGGSVHYTAATDMWSLGCVLYECIHDEYFAPNRTGPNTNETQLNWINFFVAHKPQFLLKIGDVVLRDLVDKILVVDPSARLSARDALRHPWLQRRSPRGGAVPVLRAVRQ